MAEKKGNTALSPKKTWEVAISDSLSEISDALPKDFNKARFVQNAMTMISDKPELLQDDSTRNQVIPVLMRGAVLGLDYTNKEWYPVTYGSKLEFQMSYRGAEKLARKYSIKPVKSIVCDIVRKGDDFQMEIKDNDVKVNFKPLPFNRSETIGAFAYVVFEDGTAIAETMNIDELESSRKASKMGNSGAWKNQPWEMQKKTVIKRLMKRIEIDFETSAQADYYYEDEAVIETPQDVIDVAQNDIEENQNSIPFEVEG